MSHVVKGSFAASSGQSSCEVCPVGMFQQSVGRCLSMQAMWLLYLADVSEYGGGERERERESEREIERERERERAKHQKAFFVAKAFWAIRFDLENGVFREGATINICVVHV